ncbi:bacterio-opsin activator domain-containing protein [Natrialbaceae archaeon A-gly3]
MKQNRPLLRDSITVLLVDDNEQVCNLVRAGLERESDQLSVTTVHSGPAALDRLDDDIDCVVSDYDMPGMNGLDLLREVREIYPAFPFVLLTAMGSERIASEAMSADVTDYFQKSGDLDELSAIARRIETIVEKQQAEVSYAELFATAENGFALVDPDTGAFLDVNASFLDLFGYDRHEVLEMDLGDLPTVPPQSKRETTLFDHLRCVPNQEAATIEEYCRRPDGDRLWIELQFDPITVRGRSLVLIQVRDISPQKRYQETLSALHGSVTDLVSAEFPGQVLDTVVTTAEILLGVDRAVVYLHDASANTLVRADTTGSEAPRDVAEMAVSLDPDHPVARAFIDGTPVEIDGVAAFDPALSDDPDTGRTVCLPIGSHGVLVLRNDETEPFSADDREFTEILTSAAAAALGRIENERELHSTRDAIRRQTAELERLERIQATLHELNTTLLQAETRGSVYEAMCTGLPDVPGTTLVWVGTPADDGTLKCLAWAGSAPDYLDSVSFAIDSSEEPAVVSSRTGDPVRVDNTATDLQQAPWRRTALSHGVESVLSVPIAADGVTYGVLSVLGSERGAFTEQFQEMLEAVAASAGETIRVIEQQGPQPSTTELSFEITDDKYFFQQLASSAHCSLEVEGIVPGPDDGYRVFVSVDQGSPETVIEHAGELCAVRNATIVANRVDGGTLELLLAVPILGVSLGQYAVGISQFRATPEAVTVTLEVARPEDVRAIADDILKRYPGATLRGKRSQTASDSDRDRLRAFQDSLTPRQREVVQIAYLNGYFDSPRRCTGEELGEKLGISAQAVYNHLRAAQRQLFDEAFGQLLAVPDDEE